MKADSEITKLIGDALYGLGHKECPYCQADISLIKYINNKDIEDWLKKRTGLIGAIQEADKELKE